jgi:hypothetical protein
VLEDEWMLTLIGNGRRLSPEIVPGVLIRHRADPTRRARAEVAGGPLVDWLVEQFPTLRPVHRSGDVDPAAVVTLPALPIPPEFRDQLEPIDDADAVAAEIADRVGSGELGGAHRAVLMNLAARVSPQILAPLGSALERVDPLATGHGLAGLLADLCVTRQRMIAELTT